MTKEPSHLHHWRGMSIWNRLVQLKEIDQIMSDKLFASSLHAQKIIYENHCLETHED